jgi:hypothetical protein
MEQFNELQELTSLEVEETVGGSPLSYWVCYYVGKMVSSPGVMALDGAAGHEIMGFK